MAKRKDHTVQVITISQPMPWVTKVTKGAFGKAAPEWHWLQPGNVLVVETSAGGQRWHEYRSRDEAAAHFDLDADTDEATGPSVLYDANGAVTIQPRAPQPRQPRMFFGSKATQPLTAADVTLC